LLNENQQEANQFLATKKRVNGNNNNNNNNLKVTEVDKSKIVVKVENQNLDNKIIKFINDNGIDILEHDPTQKSAQRNHGRHKNM
jgi:hypothetical protein